MPQSPMTAEQHHRTLNLLMIIVAIAIIIGVLYWWTALNSNQSPSTASNPNDMRAQVAAMLRNSPVHASAQEIESVAAQLANSKVTVTDAEKQAVANSLRQAQ
jgi:hypothetical protein